MFARAVRGYAKDSDSWLMWNAKEPLCFAADHERVLARAVLLHLETFLWWTTSLGHDV